MRHARKALARMLGACGVLAPAVAQRAAAHTFPPVAAYEGSVCEGAVSNDATADISGRSDHRDIVGSDTGLLARRMAPLTSRTVDGALRFELSPHFGIHDDRDDVLGGREWQISS